MMKQQLDLGTDGVLVVPELSASDVDILHTVIGNDEVFKAIERSASEPLTTVFAKWINGLTSREYVQVRNMCLSNARFRDTGGEVSFTVKSDEVKILSAVLYANLANVCAYMTGGFN